MFVSFGLQTAKPEVGVRRYSRMMTDEDRVRIERRISVATPKEQKSRTTSSQWLLGEGASGVGVDSGRRLQRGMTDAERAAAEAAVTAKVQAVTDGASFDPNNVIR
jgi:hypothetical protein